MKNAILALILLALPPLAAQVSNPSIVPRATAPTACTTLPLYVLTTNGDLYGDNGSGVCKVLSTPTSALSGSGTATHLPIWSAGSTLGDSPATFDGTTFVFPNPFSVQAHSAFGVGSIVDGDSGTWNSDIGTIPLSTISIFQESSTTATGTNGGVFAETWNPTATVSSGGYGPLGLLVDYNVNLDGQATADINATGFDAQTISNGNTTALGTLSGGTINSYSNSSAPVQNQYGLQINTATFNGNVGTATGLQSVLGISGTGTVTNGFGSDTSVNIGGPATNATGSRVTVVDTGSSAASNAVGTSTVVENIGSAVWGGAIGNSTFITLQGTATANEINGSALTYEQDSASANPTDFLGEVVVQNISAGTFSGLGIADFIADGGDSRITVSAAGAIPAFDGFLTEWPSAPANVITNGYAFHATGTCTAVNCWAFKSEGSEPSEFGGLIKGDTLTASQLVATNASKQLVSTTVLPSGTTIGVSNAITSATGGSGTGTVACATAACTNLRGSYTVAGGTFATGTLLTLVWPTTTAAYVCNGSVLNNATGASIGYHSIATATGITFSSLTAATGLSVDIDYSCQP